LGCLYCGKEIGPIRHLRDSEFCSSVHRKRYRERLGKALDRIAKPEPPPLAPAGFALRFPLQRGAPECATACEFAHGSHTAGIALNWWPLAITALAGTIPQPLANPQGTESPCAAPWTAPICSPAWRLALPHIECAPIFEIAASAGCGDAPPAAAGEPPRHPQAVETMPRIRAAIARFNRSHQSRRAADAAARGRPDLPPAQPAQPGIAATSPPSTAAQQDAVLTRRSMGWRPAAQPEPAERLALAEAAGMPLVPALSVTPVFDGPRRGAEPSPIPAPCAARMPAAQPEPAERLAFAEAAGTPLVPALTVIPIFDAPRHGEEPSPIPAPCTAWMPAAGPEPAERLALAEAAGTPLVPALTVIPIFDAPRRGAEPSPIPAPCAAWMPAAQPEPAERLALAAAHAVWTAGTRAPLAPALTVIPIFDGPRRGAEPSPIPAPCAAWVPAAKPEPAERLTFAAAYAAWTAGTCAPLVPALTVIPVFDGPRRGAEPSPIPAPCAAWMPAAQPEPAERLAFAAADCAPLAAVLTVAPVFDAPRRSADWMPPATPKILPFQKPQPALPSSAQYRQGPPAAAVSMRVMALSSEAFRSTSHPPAAPIWEAPAGGMGFAGPAGGPPAAPLESLPACQFTPVPLAFSAVLRQPVWALAEAGEEAGAEPAWEGPPAAAAVIAAVFEPLAGLHIVRPEPPCDFTAAQVPPAGFVPLDFHCVRSAAAPRLALAWSSPVIPARPPKLPLTPIFGRREESGPQKKAANPNSFAEIFQLPEAQRKPPNPGMAVAFKAAAACLLVGSLVWFGIGTIRIGNQTPAVNRDASVIGTATAPASAPASADSGAGTVPAAVPASGPIARLRQAIATRAAATVTDSFKNGMEAWGTAAKSWAPGWSRNPDGYVTTGQLAFFHPSLTYTDYRLEFFGQIETKSMGWAVRAHDPKNYYAMEFTVVQPGLRPIIAIEHYPVVDGKRGKATPIPLNVMVHNNTPLQVAVEVRGNKLVTSVDGQEVDTWIDDTLASGGVGFFSETGARARLYWMKISKNEDFLGRVCAYLSRSLGDANNTTAEFWNPARGLPAPAPQPAPAPSQFALAPQPPYEFSRRTQPWKS
jgi:hypothetical protein